MTKVNENFVENLFNIIENIDDETKTKIMNNVLGEYVKSIITPGFAFNEDRGFKIMFNNRYGITVTNSRDADTKPFDCKTVIVDIVYFDEEGKLHDKTIDIMKMMNYMSSILEINNKCFIKVTPDFLLQIMNVVQAM